jgi:type I restriction-modification system DNA methylase subunit
MSNNMTNIDSQSWHSLMHALHNDVRNSRGLKLTGMAALNEINNYLLLFFIERNFSKYPTLDETCKFSYMYLNFCTDEHIKYDAKNYSGDPEKNRQLNYYKIWNHWCNTQNLNCVLRKLAGSARIQKYLQNEALTMCAFTQNCDTGKTIQLMINKIWTKFSQIANSNDPNIVMNLPLESFGFDAFGDAYEKFKLDMSSNSGKTTGQHFTPDIVKSFIVNETKPKYQELFYEPACGTGGFIHHAAKYIKFNDIKTNVPYKDDNGNILSISPYEYFVKHLMANECNPEIYKPLAINMLIHDIPIERIKKQDSLDNINIGQTLNKYDIICANPPFGAGDEVNIYDDTYWGPLKTGKNVIKDAMAQFIMHMYQSLKVGGRCGTVSDRGIINNGSDGKNSWQTKLRKFMLENTNLYKIVLLPKDTFEYTTFATCILFWKKGTPTKSVEFRELTFKDVMINGQKTKEVQENKLLGTITIEQIKAKNYSLKYDDYFKVVENKMSSGWIKLGDVCEFKSGKFNSNDMDNNGEIPFYSCVSNNPVGTHSTYSFNYPEYLLFIGSGGSQNNICGPTIGMGKTYYVSGKSACRSGVFSIVTKNIITKFGYYFLNLNRYNINSKAKYSANLGVISMDTLKNILVPNLPPSHQTEIVEFLDQQFEKYQINKLNKQIPLFELLIKKEWQMASDLLHLVYRQMASLDEIENIKRDIKAVFSLSVYGLGGQSRMMKLGDVVEIKSGKRLPKDHNFANNITTHPYIKVGDIDNIHNRDDYLTKLSYISDNTFIILKNYIVNTGDLIMSSVGSVGKLLIIPESLNGANLTENCVKIIIKNNIINKYYLYLFLKSKNDDIIKIGSQGNCQPKLGIFQINDFEIPIPPLNIQQQIINKINLLNDQSSHYNVYAQILQKEIDMISDTIKNMTNSNKINCSVTDVKHKFDSNELTIDLSNIDKYYENINDLKFDKLVSNRRVIEM